MGAGLAGLAAARDLAAGGADVVVLEARDRAGGRVEQEWLPDGRPVQYGGEVVADWMSAYVGLVAELGLTLEPSYTAIDLPPAWGADEGVTVGERAPWMDEADRASLVRVEGEFAALSRGVDPDDPWSHPDAARLDSLSVGDWLRSVGARPGAIRLLDHMARSLAIDSIERTSLLAQLRKEAVCGGHGFYDERRWEHLRVAEGSATVALRMAGELGRRVRLGCVVEAIDMATPTCTVTLRSGEEITAEAVVCALPVGPLRDVTVTGVSDERLTSLHRQRNALAFKTVVAYAESFWEVGGATSDGVWASVWVQRDGILSSLTPPDRLGPFLASPDRKTEFLRELAALMGEEAMDPLLWGERLWGIDPFTQGYVTGWRPGDVMAVGPLHGTHEPPFYVCGSDQWVAGYMEGAVRTGRDAAARALAPSRS
ncbi:MAG TPA: NAD(P)/FAD-dependent oxidoreductase [Thermoleophilaceae bacterium]|nr:NAD(P)/FAD-dependent oxidoreductase [Thermoleophilaceae bacterium]